MTRFAGFDAETDHLGTDTVLVRSRTRGTVHVLGPPEAQVFQACAGTPRTLTEHAEACGALLSPPFLRALAQAGASRADGAPPTDERAAARAAVDRCIRRFVAEGLLTAEDEVVGRLARAADASDEPAGITSLCVPTRDRLPTLRRCLASFMESDDAHGRRTAFVVMDDGDDPAASRRLRAALRRMAAESGREVRHATRRDREKLARLLARRAGVPPEVARFALLGDERCATSYGAARNALLLDTVGELSLFVDDDFVCRPALPPGAAEELEVSPRGEANEYWFGESRGEVLGLVRPVDADFLALHEAYLGRSPAACVAAARARGLPVSLADPAGVAAVARADARILNSFAGIVGDVGGPGRHHPRLHLRGASFARLVADEDAYAARLYSRHLVKSPVRYSISPDSYCMAGNMGVDGRGALPPFIPAGVAEDVVFGTVRQLVAPHACSAFLPCAILHDPPEARGGGRAVPLAYVTNRVVSILLGRLAGSWPSGGAEAVYGSLGAYLRALGASPAPAFRAFVEHVLRLSMHVETVQAEQELARRADAPPWWRRSVREMVEERRALAAGGALASPPDLPGGEAERQALFQEVVRRYGELLAAWPALTRAAAELRAEGRRITSAV